MTEVYPHLFTSTYENYKDLNIIKNKKIKLIIHVSKNKKFVGTDKIEEIRLPIEFDEDNFDFEHINLELYNYIPDMIEYIYKNLKNNRNVLLLGYSHKQEVDILVCGFYMRYGNVTPQLSIYYLKSKKQNIFLPECYYESCLEHYYRYIGRGKEGTDANEDFE